MHTTSVIYATAGQKIHIGVYVEAPSAAWVFQSESSFSVLRLPNAVGFSSDMNSDINVRRECRPQMRVLNSLSPRAQSGVNTYTPVTNWNSNAAGFLFDTSNGAWVPASGEIVGKGGQADLTWSLASLCQASTLPPSMATTMRAPTSALTVSRVWLLIAPPTFVRSRHEHRLCPRALRRQQPQPLLFESSHDQRHQALHELQPFWWGR